MLTCLLHNATGTKLLHCEICIYEEIYLQVDSKMTLGFVGILVILGSVFASIGFYGYVGIATSLIVIEVVPFLVLAIGADNVFILTLEFQV